jgi:hypothetical protein
MCDLERNFEAGLSGDIEGKWEGHQDSAASLTGKKAREEAKSATKRAEQAEAERQARISGNVASIESTFNGREGQYKSFGDALRARLNEGVQLQQQNAARQSKFSLARGGLIGGSQQRDANATLNREARDATLAAERQTQKGVADLRAADEDTRSRLIALAQSGNDVGNAALQSSSALRANFGSAQGATSVANLGDLFANTASTYRAQQDAAARRRGLTEAQTYAQAFSRK